VIEDCPNEHSFDEETRRHPHTPNLDIFGNDDGASGGENSPDDNTDDVDGGESASEGGYRADESDEADSLVSSDDGDGRGDDCHKRSDDGRIDNVSGLPPEDMPNATNRHAQNDRRRLESKEFLHFSPPRIVYELTTTIPHLCGIVNS